MLMILSGSPAWTAEAGAGTQLRGSCGIAAYFSFLFDAFGPSNYSWAMESLEQTGKDLERLEQQLKLLLKQTQKLREENQSLQNRQESLVAERAGLVAKNEEARSKVEAMIHRLKALEQS
jgi:cell division protein ZapB